MGACTRSHRSAVCMRAQRIRYVAEGTRLSWPNRSARKSQRGARKPSTHVAVFSRSRNVAEEAHTTQIFGFSAPEEVAEVLAEVAGSRRRGGLQVRLVPHRLEGSMIVVRITPRARESSFTKPRRVTFHTRQKDAAWALTKITKLAGGREIEKKVGSKCDACFRCSMAFPMLEWDALCERYHGDKAFKDEFDAAAKVLAGAPKEFHGSIVQGGVEHAIDLTQKFTLLTERQLANLSQRTRLPKSIVRNVPSVELPSELGGRWEKYYVFRGKTQGYRIMTVRQTLATTMSSVSLDPHGQIRPRQANEFLERELLKQHEVSRLREVIEKSPDTFRTLEEFLPKLTAQTTKRKCDDSACSEEAETKLSDDDGEAEGEATELRGAAVATFANMAPPPDPSPHKRARSSLTLGVAVAPPSVKETSDAGSTVGGNDEDNSDGDMGFSGDACGGWAVG